MGSSAPRLHREVSTPGTSRDLMTCSRALCGVMYWFPIGKFIFSCLFHRDLLKTLPLHFNGRVGGGDSCQAREQCLRQQFKLLDIYNKKSRNHPVVLDQVSLMHHRDISSCLWHQKQVFWAKTRSFPNPNRAVLVPEPNQPNKDINSLNISLVCRKIQFMGLIDQHLDKS